MLNSHHAGEKLALARSESTVERVSWDDVRLLLHVARSGSFRAAAESVKISPNTLRRRLSSLEAELGHALLTRRNNGIRLTQEGTEVADIAMRMRGVMADLERMAHERRRSIAGTVKVAVADRLGLGWIMPYLVSLGRQYPDITIDLWTGVRLFGGPGYEADIWVQLERPTMPDLVATRLGCLHLELFASDEYIRLNGLPSSTDDLAQFHVVEQISEGLPQLGEIVPNPNNRRFIRLRANRSTSHAYAIVRGAGIGLLPTYASRIEPSLRPINCDFHVQREIWMAYSAAVKDMKQVRVALDQLKKAFDPDRNPWFRETHIPASELEAKYKDRLPLPCDPNKKLSRGSTSSAALTKRG